MNSAFAVKKYQSWFKKRLEKGDKIPAYVIKRFIKLFKTKEELQQVKKELINKITSDLLIQFDKYRYNFKFEVPPLPQHRNILEDYLFPKSYSLEDMIKNILWNMVYKEYKTKEQFIFEAFERMCNYQREKNVKEEELRTHKKYILCAYLASKVGFTISANKKPTSIQFRDAGRNAVMKCQKDKEKKVR